MARTPTNTLILTKLSPELLRDPQTLVQLLVSRNFNVELVTLPKFERYLVICASPVVAMQVREHLAAELGNKIQIGFSLKDNHLALLEDELWCIQGEKDYLELPLQEGSRRFLILPPLSPHSEWEDFGREEEGPNTKAVYSPEDLSHLLWDRFGGFDSSKVRKFYNDDSEDEDETIDISDKPHILFEDIDNGVPAIVVDSVTNQVKRSPKIPFLRTSMPPL